MKKKLLSVILVAAMAGSLLIGCGGSDAGSGTSGSGAEDGTSAAAANAEASTDEVTVTSVGEYTAENPYHCVFSYVEVYQQDESARLAVQDALNEYMIPEYHIEVEFLPMQFAEYKNKVQLAFTGGDELDIVPIYFADASSWINMNGLVDMSQYMDTPEGKAIEEALGKANAWVGQMNGVLFGFPAAKESVDLGGLFMRADICDELGITEEYDLKKNDDTYTGKVYSWDVATEIFKKVKEAHPEMSPLYLMGSGDNMNRFTICDSLLDSFGVLDWAADHDSTTVVNRFETESYLNAVTRLAEWFDAGYIYKDAMTDTQGTATMMKAGNTFSYPTPIKPGFLVEAAASNGCEGYVMYFGESVEGGYATQNVSFYDTGIATNSADPEMAFKFVAALYTDGTVMNLWQNGIEGVNYQVLDDGTAYFTDSEDASSYKYHQGTGWMMGNQFNTYVWNDGSKTAEYWDLLRGHNEWAQYSPAYGFMWDSSAYSTQLTALQNALDTYRPALETGSCGVAGLEDTLKQLNDALYAAGLQEVIDAKQEQLNAWITANGKSETPAENMEKINGVTSGVIGAE